MMDLFRAIVDHRMKFARAVFASKLPKYTKIQLLRLAKRTPRELLLDIMHAWLLGWCGASPFQGRLEVPAGWTPKLKDQMRSKTGYPSKERR
jgi:hypothetical protein